MTLPMLVVRDRKSKGIWSHPGAVEGCDAPGSCKGSDGRSGLRRGTGESSSSQIKSPALLPLYDAVKNGWHGEIA